MKQYLKTNTHPKIPEPKPTPEKEPQPAPEKEPESPKTGDSINLSAWLAVVFISGAIVFATGKRLRKIKK